MYIKDNLLWLIFVQFRSRSDCSNIQSDLSLLCQLVLFQLEFSVISFLKKNHRLTTVTPVLLCFRAPISNQLPNFILLTMTRVKTHSHTMTPFDAQEKQAF